jgi:hypothetical protein
MAGLSFDGYSIKEIVLTEGPAEWISLKRQRLWELFSFLNEPFRRTARFPHRNLYRRHLCAPSGRGCNPKTHQEKRRRHRLRTKRQRSSSFSALFIQPPRQLLRPLASRSSVSKTQEIGGTRYSAREIDDRRTDRDGEVRRNCRRGNLYRRKFRRPDSSRTFHVEFPIAQ